MKNLTGIYWIKNEARYIPEYIEFHLLQGFDHFIFYDNESDDNLLEIISPYIEQGLVEIRYYPELGGRSKNLWVMNHCCNEQKNKTKWLHFHALDERLYCPTGQKVIDFLKDYEEYGGVSVGWVFFNSNNHIQRPKGLIIDNFTECLIDEHKHVKTIIQPSKTIGHAGNPHNFIFNTSHAVDENYKQIVGPFHKGNYSYDKIKLNHYVTLSYEEHQEKMNKGILDHGSSQENIRRQGADGSWPHYHDKNKKMFQNTYLSIYSKVIKENILKRYKGKEHLLSYINY